METGKTRVQGTKVTVDTGSVSKAREIGADLELEVLRSANPVAGMIATGGRWLNEVATVVGRGTFEVAASVLLFIGGLIAFLSWSRLLPLEHAFRTETDPGMDLRFLVGIVGVVVAVFAKVSAGRAAIWQNALEDARLDNDPQNDIRARQSRDFYRTAAIILIVLDSLAAVAFAAAVTADMKQGLIDYDAEISQAEREARAAGYEADAMPRPGDPLELLQDDLARALNQEARNNSGGGTELKVAEVIGWGLGEDGRVAAVPGEDFCMPGGKYASYVDRYCAEVAELYRKVRQKELWQAKMDEKAAFEAEAQRLRDSRPEEASAAALGNELSEGAAKVWRHVPMVSLMAIIMLFMAAAAYMAKRDPRGVETGKPKGATP